jgi:hypothetical protein
MKLSVYELRQYIIKYEQNGGNDRKLINLIKRIITYKQLPDVQSRVLRETNYE